MTVATSLSSTELTVEAGGEAGCELTIRNAGDVVDQYTLELVGAATDWATVDPPVLNLMPGGQATAVVTFAPPRSSQVLAGQVPFGVRVLSREDPHGSVVEEGAVRVAPFVELVAELLPPRRRGKRRATFQLAVENNGNRPVPARVAAFEPEDDQLDIDVRTTRLETQPGTMTLVKLRTRPHKRFLRGEPKLHPFQVEVTEPVEDDSEDDDAVAPAFEPLVVDGVMIQERLLPTWVLPALGVLALVVAALVALWFTVLEPKVQSIATEQVRKEVGKDVDKVTEAAKQATDAADQANKAVEQVKEPDPTPGTDDPAVDDAVAAGAGGPVDFRIATKAAVVTDGSYQRFTFTAPESKAMDIGDLVLQNPRGDTGFLRIVLGDDVVLETGLANFRDLDYHYVNALHVAADKPVVVEVNCTTAGAGGPSCTPSVSFSGKLR